MSRRPSTPAPLDDVRELRKQLAAAANVARKYNVQQQFVCMPCNKPTSSIREEVADTGRTHDNYEQMVTHPVALAPTRRLRGDWNIDAECAICMELLIEESATPLPPGAGGDAALRLESLTDTADASRSCGHVFHQLCLYQWCRSQYGTPKCPLCNLPIHLNVQVAAANRYARTVPMPGDVDEPPPPPPPPAPAAPQPGPFIQELDDDDDPPQPAQPGPQQAPNDDPPAQPAQRAQPAQGGRVRSTNRRQHQPGDPIPPEWMINIPVLDPIVRDLVNAALRQYDAVQAGTLDVPVVDWLLVQMPMSRVKQLFMFAYRRQLAQSRMTIQSYPYPIYYSTNVARTIEHANFTWDQWPIDASRTNQGPWQQMVRPAIEQAAMNLFRTNEDRRERYIRNQVYHRHYVSPCKLASSLLTDAEVGAITNGDIRRLGSRIIGDDIAVFKETVQKLLHFATKPLTGNFDWNPPPQQ